ncbi:MurR/RpiR family transcriptional regulator [Labrys wisconsinensis]|uniref:DNA-binding MurR/RpiR family transcriptional regulator n=1 Tax=Labrys wisconsinensis TaxID=425677 RepID=A0ABU0J182_9HYPH|nr:MurR/RpiR family transcriptional regulator [Labrys wisconsinensis]MDQ0468023.1 DNA-binding MurR/RpiR family transcriptional regulator [Labrys wisconsinensis]
MVQDASARAGRHGGFGTGPLAYLEASIPDLPSASARAAVYIVENPEKVVRFSLKDLSGFSRTGEASIVRLCQMAGFSGFSDFKLALARELALRESAEGGTREEEHHLHAMGHELARSITRTAEALDLAVVEEVAARLRHAMRIDVFGAGVSGIIAELFSYRLLRAGLNAHAIRDITLAHEVANGLGPQAAALAISESGVTANTVEFLRAARAAGAYTVAVTCQARSPLARHAEALLPMAKLNIPAYGGYINAVPRAVYVAEVLAALAGAVPKME